MDEFDLRDDEFDGGMDIADDEYDSMTDAEADADVFRSIGWGTDEDYGYFGGDE